MDGSGDQIETVIQRACGMVSRGGVRSVSVVVGRPLSDDQMRELRAYASSRAVTLTADGPDSVKLRAGRKISAGSPRDIGWGRLPGWGSILLAPRGSSVATGDAR